MIYLLIIKPQVHSTHLKEFPHIFCHFFFSKYPRIPGVAMYHTKKGLSIVFIKSTEFCGK